MSREIAELFSSRIFLLPQKDETAKLCTKGAYSAAKGNNDVCQMASGVSYIDIKVVKIHSSSSEREKPPMSSVG